MNTLQGIVEGTEELIQYVGHDRAEIAFQNEFEKYQRSLSSDEDEYYSGFPDPSEFDEPISENEATLEEWENFQDAIDTHAALFGWRSRFLHPQWHRLCPKSR